MLLEGEIENRSCAKTGILFHFENKGFHFEKIPEPFHRGGGKNAKLIYESSTK